jgi:transposase InsO family protein
MRSAYWTVPTHKTGTAFTKPVDPLLGKAIEAWQDVRPAQPQMLDHKTSELADFLFAHRARRVARHYINTAIIPMLCRKAGVPTADVRGNVTSHRARSTIASQLYNAKEPMTLFELQEWLGHRTPEATAHYAKITPNTLARAYNDAGYFGHLALLYTDLALDALEMAIWKRRHTGGDLSGLVHHSDRGMQYRAIRYTERLEQADTVASVGSKGDSYDKPLSSHCAPLRFCG